MRPWFEAASWRERELPDGRLGASFPRLTYWSKSSFHSDLQVSGFSLFRKRVLTGRRLLKLWAYPG